MHFTGQVAWDADEDIVGKDDVEAQTRQCFKNNLALLAVAGDRGEHGLAYSKISFACVRLSLKAAVSIHIYRGGEVWE